MIVVLAYLTLGASDIDVAAVKKALSAGGVADYEYDERCLRRAEGFADTVVVGDWEEESKACYFRGVVVKGTFDRGSKIAAATLATAGWKTGPGEALAAKRAELAERFVRNLLLHFDKPMNTATDDFGTPWTPAFQPPQLEPTPEGGVRFVVWTRGVTGDARYYERRAYTFTPDGALTSVDDRLTRFTVHHLPEEK